MHRLALFAAAGIVIAAISPASAAARHKHKVRAPAAQSPPVMQPAFTNRPAWAAPQQCYTNDGYGRFLPCDVGDGR